MNSISKKDIKNLALSLANKEINHSDLFNTILSSEFLVLSRSGYIKFKGVIKTVGIKFSRELVFFSGGIEYTLNQMANIK